MEKTKKSLVVILVLVIGTMSLFIGCTSTTAIKDEYIVPPDPNNPYQGTWLSKDNQYMVSVMFVIKDMNATQYVLDRRGGRNTSLFDVLSTSWKKANVYTVDSTWVLSEDKNTLTVMGSMICERYVKK
jgi:hypothetical protein